MSDDQLIQLFSNDSDYKIIANSNVNIIDALLKANIDLKTFNFNDENAFLNAIGMTKNEYLKNVINVKSAASRFLLKYPVKNNYTSKECLTCSSDKSNQIEDLRKVLIDFKTNSGSFDLFKENLLILL